MSILGNKLPITINHAAVGSVLIIYMPPLVEELGTGVHLKVQSVK